MKTQAVAAPSLALIACFACLAQSPATPKFDVASIKPAVGGMRPDLKTSPGSLTIRNQSLRDLIQWAYDTPPFQIEGPAWLNDNRFDVLAKAESGGDDAKLRLMLRSLLEDRFGLKAHQEQKEMQIYGLTLAKGGPKFQESTDEGPPEFVNGGDRGTLVAHRVTMKDLAIQISDPLRRPVIDETGLKGRYEIRIDVRAFMQAPTPGGGDKQSEGQIDVMSVLFTALQQQLGVKLDSKKENVDILVIEHAEKTPTEN